MLYFQYLFSVHIYFEYIYLPMCIILDRREESSFKLACFFSVV